MSKDPKVLVIMGSARKESNTHKAVKELCPFKDYEVINLFEKEICPFYYDSEKLKGDDFLPIMKKVQGAEIIVFATPVYWYAMSGIMKNFFDRFTQLLSDYKAIGKSLKGKKTYLIAQGASSELPDGFEVPFRETSKYLGMEFQGTRYKSF